MSNRNNPPRGGRGTSSPSIFHGNSNGDRGRGTGRGRGSTGGQSRPAAGVFATTTSQHIQGGTRGARSTRGTQQTDRGGPFNRGGSQSGRGGNARGSARGGANTLRRDTPDSSLQALDRSASDEDAEQGPTVPKDAFTNWRNMPESEKWSLGEAALTKVFHASKAQLDADEQDALARGAIDPPKTKAAESIVKRGECQEMCPDYEVISRWFDRTLSPYESSPYPDASGRRRPMPGKVVKRFTRSAADKKDQIPQQLRPPLVLLQTLQYLFGDIMANHGLADAWDFLFTRTRSVRNDFRIQEADPPQRWNEEDLQLSLQCHEVIFRFHLVSLHHMARPEEPGNSSYVKAHDVEMLSKTHITLRERFEDIDKLNRTATNAPFVQALKLVSEMDAQHFKEIRVAGLSVSRDVRHSNIFEQAIKIRRAATVAVNGSSSNLETAQRQFESFWDTLRSTEVPYLMACAAQLGFDLIRKGILTRLYNIQVADQTGSVHWPCAFVTNVLGFDSEGDTKAFCEAWGFDFHSLNGVQCLDLGSVADDWANRSPDIPKSTTQLIEDKLGNESLPQIIQGVPPVQLLAKPGLQPVPIPPKYTRDLPKIEDDSLFIPEGPSKSTKFTFGTGLSPPNASSATTSSMTPNGNTSTNVAVPFTFGRGPATQPTFGQTPTAKPGPAFASFSTAVSGNSTSTNAPRGVTGPGPTNPIGGGGQASNATPFSFGSPSTSSWGSFGATSNPRLGAEHVTSTTSNNSNFPALDAASRSGTSSSCLQITNPATGQLVQPGVFNPTNAITFAGTGNDSASGTSQSPSQQPVSTKNASASAKASFPFQGFGAPSGSGSGPSSSSISAMPQGGLPSSHNMTTSQNTSPAQPDPALLQQQAEAQARRAEEEAASRTRRAEEQAREQARQAEERARREAEIAAAQAQAEEAARLQREQELRKAENRRRVDQTKDRAMDALVKNLMFASDRPDDNLSVSASNQHYAFQDGLLEMFMYRTVEEIFEEVQEQMRQEALQKQLRDIWTRRSVRIIERAWVSHREKQYKQYRRNQRKARMERLKKVAKRQEEKSSRAVKTASFPPSTESVVASNGLTPSTEASLVGRRSRAPIAAPETYQFSRTVDQHSVRPLRDRSTVMNGHIPSASASRNTSPQRPTTWGPLYQDRNKKVDHTQSRIFDMAARGLDPYAGRKRLFSDDECSDDNESDRPAHKRGKSGTSPSVSATGSGIFDNILKKARAVLDGTDDEMFAPAAPHQLSRSVPDRTLADSVSVRSMQLGPSTGSANDGRPAFWKRTSRFLPRELYGKGVRAAQDYNATRRTESGSVSQSLSRSTSAAPATDTAPHVVPEVHGVSSSLDAHAACHSHPPPFDRSQPLDLSSSPVQNLQSYVPVEDTFLALNGTASEYNEGEMQYGDYNDPQVGVTDNGEHDFYSRVEGEEVYNAEDVEDAHEDEAMSDMGDEEDEEDEEEEEDAEDEEEEDEEDEEDDEGFSGGEFTDDEAYDVYGNQQQAQNPAWGYPNAALTSDFGESVNGDQTGATQDDAIELDSD